MFNDQEKSKYQVFTLVTYLGKGQKQLSGLINKHLFQTCDILDIVSDYSIIVLSFTLSLDKESCIFDYQTITFRLHLVLDFITHVLTKEDGMYY